jgi:hypothetical protein
MTIIRNTNQTRISTGHRAQRPRVEYYLYGKTLVIFASTKDTLVVQAFLPDQGAFKADQSYWHLVKFDKSNLARKITASEFLKQIEFYGGNKLMVEAAISS